MNDNDDNDEKIKDYYIEWHDARAKILHQLIEEKYNEMVADDWSESGSTKNEAMFSVLRNNPEITSSEAAFIAGFKLGKSLKQEI